MNLLVTGGAGYIGSHIVRALVARGDRVRVLDNLSHGHREAVADVELVVGDLSDRELVRSLLMTDPPDAVLHFAAFIEVGESVAEPLQYYRNNVGGALTLLEEMESARISRFIFSSTAAVYGIPDSSPIMEATPLKPINPYGWSKQMVEQILSALSMVGRMRYVALRYFNAAGAAPQGRIGNAHRPESHLIPLVLKAVTGEKQGVRVFGSDYPTPDGTCIRDYIHVTDLADAHLLALDHLMAGGTSETFNCGYGRGYSVREVIETVRQVTDREFKVEEAGRREGDPPELVADSGRLVRMLNWKPRFSSLKAIVETAWNWEQNRRY